MVKIIKIGQIIRITIFNNFMDDKNYIKKILNKEIINF